MPLIPFEDTPLGRCLKATARYSPSIPDAATVPQFTHDLQGCASIAYTYSQLKDLTPNLLLWNGRSHELVFKLKDDG